MEEIIKELKKLRLEYQELVNGFEDNGIENLDYEETESYGVYLGKLELCDYLLNKYK